MYKDGKAVHKIHVQDNTSGNGLDKAAEKKPLVTECSHVRLDSREAEDWRLHTTMPAKLELLSF